MLKLQAKAASLTLIIALGLTACAGSGTNSSTSGSSQKSGATSGTAVAQLPTKTSNTNQKLSDNVLTGQALRVPEVVRQVKSGVVEIIAQQGQSGTATGSGFVYDNDSHILTNNHVIADASKITVVTSNNSILRAKLVGADPETDLAVLKVDKKLTPLKLGNSSLLKVGQPVVAIGSALALDGGPTVTTGVVSALNRVQSEPSSNPYQAGAELSGLIQTDAAVNPGNSGGPLLDLQGKVIGINTLGARTTQNGEMVQGINFAISINTARDVADKLIANGKVVYPFMGIASPTFVYPQTAVEAGIPYVPGEYVAGIVPNSPADRAGLRRGDIIIKIDGKALRNESSFISTLRQYSPGDKITVTVNRHGKILEKQLTLTRRPSQSRLVGEPPSLP